MVSYPLKNDTSQVWYSFILTWRNKHIVKVSQNLKFRGSARYGIVGQEDPRSEWCLNQEPQLLLHHAKQRDFLNVWPVLCVSGVIMLNREGSEMSQGNPLHPVCLSASPGIVWNVRSLALVPDKANTALDSV